MWSSRTVFESDACPVGDEFLGTLYRASPHGLAELVETVSSDVRAMLALFCYRRAHLHSLSLAIAASCNERDLTEQGGTVGSTLFALSREAPSTSPVSAQSSRRSISLSTAPLSTFVDVNDDDFDDEDDVTNAAHAASSDDVSAAAAEPTSV
ncbi:hypothetical protein [Bradyrhizobium sp. SYSU BS000235]|uniref:hypothetical protein n=1 Tax=Bradyrhizobium sp. SYSU BS000235 TaxID=3411332 RepID=UPI003C73499E